MDSYDNTSDSKDKKMEKIVFFDVDGTLYRRDCRVPKSAVEAIQKLVDNGNYAFMCTGRGAGSIPDEVHALPLHGGIAGCGTYVSLGDDILVDAAVTGPDIDKIFEILKKYDCPYFVENVDYLLFNEDFLPEVFKSIYEAYNHNYPEYFKPFSEIYPDRISKMTCYPKDRSVLPEVRKALSPWFELISHDEYEYVEIVLKGYNKGTGIQKILDTLGIKKEDSYGFGDSGNDIPMLDTVGHGIVMGDAPDELKEKYISTDSLYADGIKNALERLGLI